MRTIDTRRITTTHLLLRFIYSISSVHKDIFVVGDDDQSIYGWRGADISNILNFKEAFGDATIIKLEQNYRSTKTILDAAWHIVSKNINRAEKSLWTDNLNGEIVSYHNAYNEKVEANKYLAGALKKVYVGDLHFNVPKEGPPSISLLKTVIKFREDPI